MGRHVFSSNQEQAGANRFGLWLFLAALGILFAAALLGMLAIRMEAVDWPADLPPLPGLLWVSTGFLLASTAAVQWAVWTSRHDRYGAVRWALGVSLLMAVGFLVFQVLAWFDWVAAVKMLAADSQVHRMAGSGLLVLGGLHAAHLIGGLIPLSIVTWYAVVRNSIAPSLSSISLYWHFLDIVWIVLVLFMLVVLY